MIAAITQALEAPRVRYRQCLNWSDTTDRVLDPRAYPETRLYPQPPTAAPQLSSEAALSH